MRFPSFLPAMLLALAVQSGAAQSWVTTIDTLPKGFVYDIAELPDGSLFFTGGYDVLPPFGYPQMAYGKLSSDGQLLWLKKDPNFVRAYKVFIWQDRVFVFASDASLNVPFYYYLLEFDQNGALVAQKHLITIGALRYDLDFDATGNIYMSYLQEPKERLMKLDPQFNTVWDVEIGDTNHPDPFSTVRVMPDGSIQWCGFANSQLRIIRFNGNGSQLTSNAVSVPYYFTYRTSKAKDGGFFLTRSTPYFFAQKIDQQGNPVWLKMLYEGNQLSSPQFAELSSGNLILFGADISLAPYVPFFNTQFVATFSSSGEPLYSQNFRLGNANWHESYGMQAIGQNAAVLGANLSTVNQGDGPVVLAKWDSTMTGLAHWAEGNAFLDENQNCLPENGEPKFPKVVVRAAGAAGSFYSVSDDWGHYRILLPNGQFELLAAAPSAYFTPCPASVAISLGGQADSVVQDFGFKNAFACPDLTAELTVPRLRRCFDNPATVHFCNLGTAAADNAYLDLTLDKWLSLAAANAPFSPLGNGKYRFELGKMDVFECRDISLTLHVDCDSTVVGQTHCAEAHIFPDTICQQAAALWSGASIEVNASCEGDSIRFFIKNKGSATTAKPCEFRVIEDDVIMNIWQETLAAGQQVDRAYPANGHFWRLEAAQEPGHPGVSAPSVSVEGCNGWASGSFGLWAAFAQDDASPAVDIDCLQNIGSFDPNEKTASPTGIIPVDGVGENIIPKNQDIEYTIHFQNTGTDTAFTVVVTDTIDQKLRPETLRLGGASHPYSWEITGPGLLKMTFEKINLPDSSTNLAGSQGWFSYRVSQKPDLADGSQIRNRAAIFFDFNAPILTNRTLHTIGTKFLSVKTWSPAQPDFRVQVFPNPTSDEATFLVKGDGIREGDGLVLQLFDLNGRLVLIQNFTKNGAVIYPGGLADGLYFFKINRENGEAVGAGKLLVE